jgi:probable HAF family extracellular repeat protein
LLLISAVAGTLFATDASAQSTLQGLGFINGGGANPFSSAGGVSGDGTVVVGASSNASNQTEAFRWTSGGMVGLGFLPGGTSSVANSVSGDGNITVGYATAPGFQFEAVKWSAAGIITPLGVLGVSVNTTPFSNAVSANTDGSVIVGYSSNALGNYEAFRWTQAGMQGLGYIGSGGPTPFSQAEGVSADGTVIVGDSTNAAGIYRAFRLVVGGTMQDLGVLPGAPASGLSNASAITPDGTVIVGRSTVPTGTNGEFEAIRWTQATGMVGLGFVGTGGAVPTSQANSVSANGSVIVGDSTNSSSTDDLAAFAAAGDNGAFRWSNVGPNAGMKNLYSLLASTGVNVSSFKSLDDAAGVSANGQFIAGTGTDASNRSQAFLARYIDPTSTTPALGGLTTPESLINSVNGLADSRQGLMA